MSTEVREHRVGCPSTMWVIGIELGCGGKHLNLCHLTGPKSMLLQLTAYKKEKTQNSYHPKHPVINYTNTLN